MGGGGQHYKPSVVVWGWGRLRNKNLAGGVAEEMTGLPKIAQPPPPINNDRPLNKIKHSCVITKENLTVFVNIVDKKAMIRSRYNRIPHPALNTKREWGTYN